MDTIRRLTAVSPYEQAMEMLLRSAQMRGWQREYRFAAPRRWRFDFAFPDQKLAIEIEGGIWQQGRHVRGRGFHHDCEKYNHAAVLGWRILRFTPIHFRTPRKILAHVAAALCATAAHTERRNHKETTLPRARRK